MKIKGRMSYICWRNESEHILDSNTVLQEMSKTIYQPGYSYDRGNAELYCALYADVLFLDAKHCGVSVVNWLFYAPVVMDKENLLLVVCFALCTQQSNAAYQWVLETLVKIVPTIKELTKVTLSDQLVSEDILQGVLVGLLVAALCNWPI